MNLSLPPDRIFESSRPKRRLRAAAVAAALGGIALLPFWLAAKGAPQVTEALSFELNKLPVDHQGPQVIDLRVKLTYVVGIEAKQYPDFESVYREIAATIKAYPNETDYWEVFNKAICHDVLGRYPVVAAVETELRVHPTFSIPYSHASHCTVAR
ncbi:MAG: hypothetical protein U1F61_01535 [Opitutaceae bacterium]